MQTIYSKVRGGTVPMLDIRERGTIERIVAKEGFKFGFIVWLVVRILLSVWGVTIMAIAPSQTYPNVVAHYPGAYVPNGDTYSFALGIWNVHDTQHYISIADNGYSKEPIFYTAFFPGFPLLIKLIGFLLG